MVLLDGQRVRAATAAAGRARIRAGMTIGEARARAADLRVAHWDEDTVAQAITRATAAFVQASPQVTPAAGSPGTWWVGASGLDALGGEPALARCLLALARRWHPRARIGIADSCVAARAATWATAAASPPSPRRRGAPSAARVAPPAIPDHVQPGAPPHDPGIVIVPPGRCAAYLAAAPLGLVPMDEAMRETLQALGVRTVGAFAALDGEDVERRWGDTGLAAWRLSHGEDRRRPVLARLEAPRAIATELSPSVPTMEPVLFLIRAALDRLVQDLVRDGRAAAVVAITLTLDDARGALPVPAQAHTITREVRLPRPLARVVPLLERCRALLETWRLDAPVCAVAVAVTATAPLLGAQGELLDPAWRDPAAADAAFARLRSALGTDAVVRPVARDSHRPEQAGTWERVDDPGDGRWRDSVNARHEPRSPRSPHSPHSPHSPRSPRNHRPPEPRSAAPATSARPAVTTPSRRALAAVPSSSTGSHREPASPSLALVRTPPADATLPRHGPALPLRAPASRQLETPERADVQTADHEATSPPLVIRWRDQVITVAHAVGPERLAGDWWGATYARDYWRCEDAGGTGHLILYRDCITSPPAWYVHAWYD